MKISVVSPTIRPEGLRSNQESLKKQTFKDFEWLVEVGIGHHDLNASYNRMLRRARGELIVSMQDWIKAPPDYLQKFWDAYENNPDTFFTAPVGKVDDLDKPEDIRWDWRAYEDAKPDWRMWEIDSGAAPLKALKEIGGFDEELDLFWSSDNVNVGCRAELAGYKIANLFSNPVIVYDHDKFTHHPFRENFNPDFNNKRMDEFRQGLKIDYLS
jgi:GT2 family glycosyltransferase